MSNDLAMDKLELAGRLVGYSTCTRYKTRGDFVFAGIQLADTHVLDVGTGAGAWAIWAALHGANRVVGIEPEADGSSNGTLNSFCRTIKALNLQSHVEARPELLHELPMPKVPFDVVVMYNVINHLDEGAVIVLHRDEDAVQRYVALLQNLRLKMHPDGWLIVADCARDNSWLRLGLRSPFARSIEWEKHQNPQTWIDVFERAGFRYIDLRWSPLQPFPKLTANWFIQYLTCSHFVLRLRASQSRISKHQGE